MRDETAANTLEKADCLGVGDLADSLQASFDIYPAGDRILFFGAAGVAPCQYVFESRQWQKLQMEQGDLAAYQTRTSGHYASQVNHESGKTRIFFMLPEGPATLLACLDEPTGTVTKAPFPVEDQLTLQALLAAEARLFVLSESANGQQQVHVSSDPMCGGWEAIELPEETLTPGNRISHLAAFNDQLYLTCDNPIAGFQLWCRPLASAQVASWTLVLKEGAYHYSANAHVSCMLADDDRLLIATAAEKELTTLKSRPVGPEIIAVDKENNWMLVMGTTRTTDEGLAVPISCMDRGFDDMHYTRISALCKHGQTYVASVVYETGTKPGAPMWLSNDLQNWQSHPLPEKLGNQTSLIGVDSLPQGLALTVWRNTDASDQPGIEGPTVAEIPAGTEFWLLYS